MKKMLALFIVILAVTSCSRQDSLDQPTDKWNGYAKYLKTGEVVHTLWAGKNIDVGTATYGIDENANFYVTYDCSASGWTISETHMFAGDKQLMPLNKPGSPKIGQFPNSGTHSPNVSSFTYYVPLSSLPPCEMPGFVVASHCCVHSPSGQNETAWAEGDYTFTDKGWGWYDIYFYNQPPNVFTILYGTAFTNDSLKLYHIDITNGTVELILKEYVGNTSGSFDGTAYDIESGMLFFTNYTTGELWVNNLKDDDISFSAGMLIGTAASGTYDNGAYYYVNEELNSINMVTFNTDWTILNVAILDTIPSSVVVNDIAMSPAGDYLYMVGEVNGGSTELITWDVTTHTFYSTSLAVGSGVQIAYGSDGVLYAIAPVVEGGSYSLTYILDTSTGTLTPIEDDIVIIDDPFSDISRGPLM